MTKKDLGGWQVGERLTIEEKVEKRLKEEAQRKAFKEHSSILRHDTRRNGVMFWDAKGSGRIVKGKKIYH